MENTAETTEQRLNRLEQRLNTTVESLEQHAKLTDQVIESLKIAEEKLRNLILMGRRP